MLRETLLREGRGVRRCAAWGDWRTVVCIGWYTGTPAYGSRHVVQLLTPLTRRPVALLHPAVAITRVSFG